MSITSPVAGDVIDINNVNDPLFANEIIGDGVAILADDDDIYAPVNGVVSVVYKTKHAIGITNEKGVEILIHLGIDTVRLDGKYFETFVQQGQKIKSGQKIMTFDRDKILDMGYDTTVLLVVMSPRNDNIKKYYRKNVSEGNKVIDVFF